MKSVVVGFGVISREFKNRIFFAADTVWLLQHIVWGCKWVTVVSFSVKFSLGKALRINSLEPSCLKLTLEGL